MAPLYGPSSPPANVGTNPMQPKNIKVAVPISSAKNMDTIFCHVGRSKNWFCSAVPESRKSPNDEFRFVCKMLYFNNGHLVGVLIITVRHHQLQYYRPFQRQVECANNIIIHQRFKYPSI